MTFARIIVVSAALALTAGCGDSGGEPDGAIPGGNTLALLFDGVDDFGSAGDVENSLGATLERFSISLWFKAVDTPQTNATMLQFNPELETGADSMQVSLLWTSPSEVTFRVAADAANGPSAEVASPIEEPASWNHILLTFDSTATSDNIRAYINGVEGGAADLSTPLDAVGNIQFGRQGSGINHYSGLLDEAALWDVALASEEAVSVYNSGTPPDLLTDFGGYMSSANVRSLWRMGDENVGDELNVSDLISENHFTVVGGGTFENDTP